MSTPDETVERAYRVFITELASPQAETQDVVAIRMRLRIGIPVFVAPTAGLPTATLDFVESMMVDNQVFMRFRNNGNMHVKVTEVQYSTPGLADKVVTPALLYVLPGQTGYLPVALPDGESVGKVTLVTDTLGTQEYELPFSP
jgi:P pilus assembly chaperone PapD